MARPRNDEKLQKLTSIYWKLEKLQWSCLALEISANHWKLIDIPRKWERKGVKLTAALEITTICSKWLKITRKWDIKSEVGRGPRNDINWDDEPLGNQLWSPSDNQHQQQVDKYLVLVCFSVFLWWFEYIFVCVCVCVCVFVGQRVEEYSFVSRINSILLRQAEGGRGQRKWTSGFIWFIAKLLLFNADFSTKTLEEKRE